MRTRAPALIVALAGLLLTACTSSQQVEEDPVREQPLLGDEAVPVDLAPDVPEIDLDLPWPGMVVDADWLLAHHAHEDVLVLHIGWPEHEAFFEEGAIPGQYYVPFAAINDPADYQPARFPDPVSLAATLARLGIDDERRVVLTGDREGLLATRFWVAMDLIGQGDRAAILDGGLAGWRDAGHPTETRPLAARPDERGALSVSPRPEILVDTEEILANIVEERFIIVDARPGEEYRGEVPGDDVERPGHIPGAASYPWKEMLTADDRPALRPVAEIAAGYAERDLSEDALLVTSCRTGLQASFGYFVARHVGREARVYDPSYLYWQSDPERPIVRIIP